MFVPAPAPPRTVSAWALLLSTLPGTPHSQQSVQRRMVKLNSETWFVSDGTICEGTWVLGQSGSFDTPQSCLAKCREHAATQPNEQCEAFAHCPECFLTECWLCIHEPSSASWTKKNADGDTKLYEPGSICPAGMAALPTVSNQSECLWCKPGWHAAAQQTRCTECPVGQYVANCGISSEAATAGQALATAPSASSATCASAFAGAAAQTAEACPRGCLFRGGSACVPCEERHMQMCGPNGGCHADGSDSALSSEELAARGCRCKPGFQGAPTASNPGAEGLGAGWGLECPTPLPCCCAVRPNQPTRWYG
jgi:hypothetical protein